MLGMGGHLRSAPDQVAGAAMCSHPGRSDLVGTLLAAIPGLPEGLPSVPEVRR